MGGGKRNLVNSRRHLRAGAHGSIAGRVGNSARGAYYTRAEEEGIRREFSGDRRSAGIDAEPAR